MGSTASDVRRMVIGDVDDCDSDDGGGKSSLRAAVEMTIESPPPAAVAGVEGGEVEGGGEEEGLERAAVGLAAAAVRLGVARPGVAGCLRAGVRLKAMRNQEELTGEMMGM